MKIDFTFDGKETDFLHFVQVDKIKNLDQIEKSLTKKLCVQMKIESICRESTIEDSNRIVIIAKSVKGTIQDCGIRHAENPEPEFELKGSIDNFYIKGKL